MPLMPNVQTALVRTSSCFAALALLAGCGTMENLLGGDRIDYRSQAQTVRPLEVPPDLTQLARDSRYQAQASVSAAGLAAASTAAPANPLAGMRVERNGNTRWLFVPMAPDALFPQARAFWVDAGFVIANENAAAGLLETDWAENRAKLPQDLVSRTVGRVFDSLRDTGERDRFRMRIERTEGGSEVFISHRGAEEVVSGGNANATVSWKPRANDPALEAEFLQRLMVRLGARAEPARTAVAQAAQVADRARALSASTLEVDDGFERAWRRVGLALDRSGFTVEDRDRNAGLYFVRYVDPRAAGVEDPGWFARLFGGKPDASAAPVRFRITVKADGAAKSNVALQASSGEAVPNEVAQRVIAVLVNELKQ
jgi:outer membrane protein assembly factor BamC